MSADEGDHQDPIEALDTDDEDDPIEDDQLNEYREMVSNLGIFPVREQSLFHDDQVVPINSH